MSSHLYHINIYSIDTKCARFNIIYLTILIYICNTVTCISAITKRMTPL